VLGQFDWEPYPDGPVTSRCTDMVDRSLASGARRLHFTPTLHFESARRGGISSYCYMSSDHSRCVPFDQVSAALQARII
jgi:hypothetical protein